MRAALTKSFLAATILVLAPASALALEPENINRAIERGVAALRNLQGGGGTWTYPEIGATALGGLTLLECGAKPTDPAVVRAAEAVRAAAPTLTHTYSLALTIVFLDRLGSASDVPAIQVLAARLLAGQGATGGWGYNCPPIGTISQASRLLPTGNDRAAPGLGADVRTLLENTPPARGADSMGDNSNTQFATLALWIARRHSVPTDAALQRVALRFRSTQNADGGWAYNGGGVGAAMSSTATMTAAGTLCLAVADGAAVQRSKSTDKKNAPLARDRNLQIALLALGTAVGQPVSGRRGGGLPIGVPQAGGKSFYYLWSLERVCVVLGLDKLGGKDWHTWGAEILLVNQRPDGSWQGDYSGGGVDTCFALLFLVRSNLAKDLTTQLRTRWASGDVTLKSGGSPLVSGKGTLGIKSAIEPGSKSSAGAGSSSGSAPATVDPPRDSEASRFAVELVGATGSARTEVMDRLRDTKGVANTEALALAIPQLGGEDRRAARDALAERLSRMSDPTLARYLKDTDAEIRRAAAIAFALRDSKTHIPDLIELLNDREQAVVRGAHAALRELTNNRELGPEAAAWKQWWAKQR